MSTTTSFHREIRPSPSTLQLKYAKLHSQSNSRIPIKSSKSSRSISIQQLDEISIINGQTKKSYIPRITSSPIQSLPRSHTSADLHVIRQTLSPIVNNTTVTPSKRTLSSVDTPPSTLTKLSNELASLTLNSPITPTTRTATATKTASTLDPRSKRSPLIRSTFSSNLNGSGSRRNVNNNLNNNFENSPKSQNSQRSVSSPMALRPRTRVMTEESYNRVPTRSIPRESPTKRSVSSSLKKQPTTTDTSPLLSRLTKATTASDLKSSAHASPRTRIFSRTNQKAPLPPPHKVGPIQQIETPIVLNKRIVSDLQSTNLKTRATKSSRLKHEASMVNLQSKINTIKENQEPTNNLNIPKRRTIPKSYTINSNLKELNLNQHPSIHQSNPHKPITIKPSGPRPISLTPTASPTPVISAKKKQKIASLDELQYCLSTHPSTSSILKEIRTPVTTPHLKNTINPPKTPQEILETVGGVLNSYEKMEIMKNKEIYYLGTSPSIELRLNTVGTRASGSIRKHDSSNFEHNFGFDDEDKNLLVTKGDHINYRYEVLNPLGNGMFGNVLRCYDHKLGRVFGVKIMKNDINWSLQSINEIKILRSLQSTDNDLEGSRILKYIDHFNFRSHICITTELLSFNLLQVLESTNFEGFQLNIIKTWSIQLLSGLKFIHDNNIIHADLKPENIMLSNIHSLDLKIIDFGSSCSSNDLSFPYIQSRFYRAPEVLIGARYNTEIDIWSFITLVYELHTGVPLFQARDESELFKYIVRLIGYPTPKTILNLRNEVFKKGSINKNKNYEDDGVFIDKGSLLFTKFDRLGNYRGSSLETPKSSLFTKRIGLKDSSFANFLQSGLCWDPRERPDARKLLQHDFLKQP